MSVNESRGSEILVWMEKAPPIVTSPSLDSIGNSGLPSIRQRASSPSAQKAPNTPITTTHSSCIILSHTHSVRGLLKESGKT